MPKRKPTRLSGFDYSATGAYFITICTQNVYTYGIKIIKDEFAYQILSDILGELLTCLNELNGQQAYDLKDAIHNVPIILAEENKHMKKNIAREVLPYRNKWKKCFLKKLIK